MKSFEEVQKILGTCERGENRDHAFGDREVYWSREGEDLAFGYFGGGTAVVGLDAEGEASFSGDEAFELLKCGATVVIERNDSTAFAVTYQDGAVMPGLTLEGVRKELTQGE